MNNTRTMWPRSAAVAVLFCAAALAAGQSADVKALEARGEAEFSKRDCVAAARTYAEAAAGAESAGEPGRTDFYYRRIGICRARLGDMEGALAAYRKGMKAAAGTGDGEMLEENVHGAALMLQKLGRLDEAIPLAQEEYEMTRKCGHPDHLVRAMWLVSDFDYITGKLRESIQLLEGALRISPASDTGPRAILLDNLAIRYYGLGDLDAAIAMEKEVISLTDPANAVSLAITLSNLGAMQQAAGKKAEAGKTFAMALERATAPESLRIRVAIMTNLAKMELETGNAPAAAHDSLEALNLARQLKIPLIESEVERFRAEMFLEGRTGTTDPADAAEAAEAALRLGRQAGSSERTYEALFSRGKVEEARGDHFSARKDFAEALGITELLRAETPGEASDLSGAFESRIPLYRAAVSNLLSLRLTAEAVQQAEQAKARVLMDILLRGGVDERAAMTATEVSERNRLRRNLAAANSPALNRSSPGAQPAVDLAAAQLRQFERDLYASHPQLMLQSAGFQAAGPDRLSALLTADNRALLDYFYVPSGVALFVIRKSGVSAFVLPDPKNTLAGEIHRFREQLANRDLDYKTAARGLFDRLLAPAMAALGSATDWIISPDGAVWEVPFAALVDPSGRHVLETRSLTVAPSLTAAALIQHRNPAVGEYRIPLLAVGNPLPSVVPLPSAAEEVRRIGAGYAGRGAVVLTGTSATREAFLAQAPDAEIIHLAAHAALSDRDPLSSYVAFGGTSGADAQAGMLTARDIMDLHLRAGLVVLSACDTALGDTRPGEGMIGMGWALSVAGAASSMLSYWKVDSAASRDFMIALYKRMPSGTKAAALRSAALDMMQSPGHRHPFYWAPFTLWGS